APTGGCVRRRWLVWVARGARSDRQTPAFNAKRCEPRNEGSAGGGGVPLGEIKRTEDVAEQPARSVPAPQQLRLLRNVRTGAIPPKAPRRRRRCRTRHDHP